MKNNEALHKLFKSVDTFKDAYVQLLIAVNAYESETGKSVNDIKAFVNHYPFDCTLEDLPILSWATELKNSINHAPFKVLNYEYLNTGGNCMVGIFTVWIPSLKQTVYVLTNEVGCSIVTADYISNELDIEDYDEITIDACDFESLCSTSTYFELYRYCLNEYTKSDCKYFGGERPIPYDLLSDELQNLLHDDYRKWLDENNGGAVPTDGYHIIVHPDYDVLFKDPHDEDRQLQDVKAFKEFHDTTAGVEDYYNEDYVLTFAGRTIRLPFYADVWEAVNSLIETAIETW